MKSSIRTLLVAILVVAFVAACASKPRYSTPASPSLPSQIEPSATPVQSSEYELPPVLNAEEVLPPELHSGPHHYVDSAVFTYGFMNSYLLSSEYDSFEVTGDDMLRIRVQEIQAIAIMEQMSKSKEFGNAVKEAAKSPFRAAKNLIVHPVSTISGIPKGAWRYLNRVGEMTRGKRGEQEEGISKELIGFSAVKRQYAYALNVDVYSSNEVLQRYLNSVSWASYAGGMPVGVAMAFIPGGVGIIVKATNVSQQLNQLLRDNAPEDLRRINRAKLRDAGLNRQLIEDFLNHPQYSPRHTTFLTDALANIGGARGKGLFLRMALSAESEEDALLFQRLAEMMRGYHDKISPVKEITLINDLPAIYAHNDALVLPLVLDYGVWTEAGDLIAQALSSFELDRERILSREAWITGSLSPRARKELAARGIAVHEGAFDELYPQPGGSEQTE